MRIRKPKWLEIRKRRKKEERLKRLHNTPEPSSQIIYSLPTVGDTTVAYDYNDILDLYNDADLYAIRKIESGIKVDDKTGKFLKQDVEVRCMMLRALLIERRERHRNARISINEEKRAYKEQLEFELKELQMEYDKLRGGE